MSTITIQKDDLPFLFGGNGNLTVDLAKFPPDAPLAPGNDDLLNVKFGAAGNTAFTFGQANQVKLSIQADSSAELTPLWPTSTADRLHVLAAYGLDDYFSTHPDDLLLVLTLGASASAAVAGTFPYSVLTATATLDVGGNVGYTYIRPASKNTVALTLLKDYFSNLRLPSNVTVLPIPGEVLALQYGGYLKVGAGLSVGYELSGSPGFAISQLQLSEHYHLSVIGKLAIGAQVAGQFSIQVSSAEDADGNDMPGWVRVVVTRQHSSQVQVSADVNVDATSNIEGLPDSANDFLGALLGVNAKNWLNLIQQVHDLADFNAIQNELDNLGKRFISEWVGKAFDALPADFTTFLGTVQKVVDSYQSLDNSAITLFDRYFNRLDFLTTQLNNLIGLTSWDNLKGEVNGDLWQVVQQLTDGDPLSWILGHITVKNALGQPVQIPSLPELKNRVQQTLDLIQSDAHTEIRNAIAVAKKNFPLDGFLQQLDQIDTVPKLKALVNQKLGDFIERLTGKLISAISSNQEFTALVQTIQKVTTSLLDFETNLYAKFKDALNQSFAFALHAEYSRATEQDALIDIAINAGTPQGLSLLRAAAQGDFQLALASYQPDLVKLSKGVFTHTVTEDTSFSVNVVGWHSGWHYQGFDKIITNTRQQITAEANGGLTVYSTIDLNQERDRETASTKLHTNLLLRFLGESRGVVPFDSKNQQYLIDMITGMVASYGLSFQNANATRERLAFYTEFAGDFGLAGKGATLANILTFLRPAADGKFGTVTFDYQVRYTELGLRRLFMAPFDEGSMRSVIRTIVLGNYLQDSGLTDVGWCYFSKGTYQEYSSGPAQFTNHLGEVEFDSIDASPFAGQPAPPLVRVNPNQLQVIATLYSIEDNIVQGFSALDALIRSGTQMQPHQFENALRTFGSALDKLEGMSNGVNTIFAVIDQLILKQVTAAQARDSSLEIDFQLDKTPKTLVYLSAAG